MKEIFTDIIKHHRWSEVLCGSGSTINFTAPLREALPEFLIKHNITSMFDAPCGDYSWMSLIEFPPGFKYRGGDIVDHMVTNNQEKYPGVYFRVFDLTTDQIPDVDLLFCRDCLIHLSLSDIDRVFANIARSNVKYVLTTNFYNHLGCNHDIRTGAFRPVKFDAAPYDFPAPLDQIDDTGAHESRAMALWPKEVFVAYVARKGIDL